ncbi:MAG: TniB family NTP-binding protein [Candidatus Helarchaeota archaeon]|nr:TniB family NTP-binding protein [Candidatus Helarchaeota archaeon]
MSDNNMNGIIGTFDLDSRIKYTQKEYFYEYNQAFEFWNKIMILMMQPKTKTKIKGLLLTGAPDSGKSTLVQQFQYEYLQNVRGAQERDIVLFNVPQGVGARQVFAQLCRKLNIPDIPNNPRNDPVTHFIVKSANKLKQDHKLLIVDEFQNLYEVQGGLRKKIISSFNQLINESRIPIVLVGVTGVNDILRSIENDLSNLKGTFSSRFPEYKLSRWEDNEEFQGLLKSLYEDLHLNPEGTPSFFYYNDEIREKIIEYSQGLLGRIITLLKETAIKIFCDKLPEKITPEILKETAIDLEYTIDSDYRVEGK